MMISGAKAAEACGVLGIEQLSLVSEETVTRCYREMAKACHPDSGTYDPAKWQRIGWARGVLTAWLKQPREPVEPTVRCAACQGSGRVKLGTLKVFCTLCAGSGARIVL